MTEAVLDKAHKIAIKKAIENLRELVGLEKNENAERNLKTQLQKELIILKEKNEEERQLFLDDLTNDLVERYKDEIKILEEKTLQQKSKEMIKQLLVKLEETLEANDDEDQRPIQQLESKLKKIEGKYLTVKEREIMESSELTEKALDFSAKDYLQTMEKALGDIGSRSSFKDFHNEVRDKCLEKLEEDLGAEWENGVEERLDARLLPLLENLEEKYRIGSKSNSEEPGKNSIAAIELARREALNYYGQEITKLIENRPLKEEVLDSKSKQLAKTILQNHIENLNSLKIQGNLQEIEEKLKKDLSSIYFPLKAENAQKLELTVSQTKHMTINCLKEYQTIMSQELSSVQSPEELQILHEAAYHRSMVILKTTHLAQHDPAFVEIIMLKLKNEIQSAFEEIWELFEMKSAKEAGDIASELRKCRQFYEDEMDKYFRSNEFIKPEELERLHQKVSDKALKTVMNFSEAQNQELKSRMEEIYVKYAELNAMNSQEQPAIGIDLGTTYCCTATYAKGKVHVVRNGIGKNTTPSYVAFKNGKELIGDSAKNQAYSNPENTIFDAKRIIGRKFGDPKLQEDMRLWPFSVVDEQGVPKIAVGDRNLHPEEISAKLLKQLKLDAEAYLGEKVTKAVITVPAYFTDGQRQATIDAGTMAGLNVLSILAEPTAAALAYKLQHSFENRERYVLIFDLGGGTFDVAVMKTSKGKIDILAVDGDTHLGGEDFDKSLMEYCAVEFKKQHNIDLFDGRDSNNKQKKDEVRRKLKRLQGECEKRKIELAAARLAEVNVDNMHGDVDLSVMVTRETFEGLNVHFFQKTIEVVEKALTAAKLNRSEIDDVVLVGGSTRIPKVQELLKKYFGGKTLDCSINPDEAVAYGAAMNAAMLNGSGDEDSVEYEEIQDVAPMSIGVQVYGGGFSVIIPKSTKTPVKAKERYKTAHDNQTSVQITIYQGEDKIAAKNEKLGDFYLNGIPPQEAGKRMWMWK
ncbi:Heat shock 70 kDa protein [Orchesella cincta]|uniref:Heat shock 70 kDa protein n=1 Tax=Orchesella cincta TaxID=48709 RepID=A0A1D2M310_ORCCI|nr:Heat shock 70 kDa protein [Orchesella cincta]